LKDELVAVEGKLSTLHGEVKQVHLTQLELEKKGITEKNLVPILQSDIQGPEDLMERIQTKKQHLELKAENVSLNKKLEITAKQKELTEKNLVEIAEKYKSRLNEFDELQSRHSLWVTAIQLIVSTLKLGFTVNILSQIVRELLKLSIKGEPKRSAGRVLSRMNKVVKEIELDDAIARKQAMLVTLEEQYSELASTIEALTNDVLRHLEAAQNTGIRSIESVSETAKAQISQVAGQSAKAIQTSEESTIRTLDNIRVKSIVDIEKLEGSVSAVFFNNHFAVTTALDLYKDKINEWGNVQQQVGRYNELIKISTVFLAIQLDETALLNMDPAIVVKLVERAHKYIQMKWPNAKTKAPNPIARKEIAISDSWEVDLISVSSWLVEALRQLGRRN
jgi:chaperonin cofactor prefoldin